MSTEIENPGPVDPEQPKGYAYKYKRLYDLGSDRMAILENMLTNGESAMKCVEHIQNDWGECTSVKPTTLEKQIQRYNKDVLQPKLAVVAEQAIANGATLSKEMKKFREQVDVLQELNQSINMQGERIKRAYAQEMAKGPDAKLDQNINKELRAFTDLCRALASLQLETGVLRRVPKQVQGFFGQLGQDELAEFRTEMTQNDETLKSLGIIKDVLEEAAQEVIDGDALVSLPPQSDSVSGGDGEPVESG